MLKTLIIGAQNIDIFVQTKTDYSLHDSNPSKILTAFGGVACNIAANLALLGNNNSFMTVFGDDTFSSLAKKNLQDLNINTDESLELTNKNSSIYIGVMDRDKDLFLGLNDMEIVSFLTIDFFKEKANFIDDFDLIVIDNNLNVDVLEYLLKTYKEKRIITDAVSARKAIKLNGLLKYISLLKLNLAELKILSDKESTDLKIDDLLDRGLKAILLTNSENEIIYKSKHEYLKTLPIKTKTIASTSGAGDAFLSGFIHGLTNQKNTEQCIEIAKKTAFLTLSSHSSTNPKIKRSDVE